MKAWGGISSLQLRLPVVWTEARRRGHTLTELARWLAEAPAELCGLSAFKGSIEPGRDADLLVFDPDAAFNVEPALLHHRHKLTPYAGRELQGVVTETFLRGEKIFERGIVKKAGAGRLLTRAAESAPPAHT